MGRRFEDKVALVTGASSGLGKATALAMAREGARLVLAARREAETEATAGEIRSLGGEAIVVPTDVTSPEQVAAMVEAAIRHYGRLDVAFNNAGVFPPEGLLHESSEELWDDLVDINLKGTWLCMKHELPHMLDQGCGSIVNMASSAGTTGWSDSPIYSATKHGIIGLTRSAALQYAPMGIRINVVCPAFTRIETVQAMIEEVPDVQDPLVSTIPLGRLGEMRETADAVLFLASDDASFCVGHALVLDGGQTAGLWRPEP